MRRQKRQGTAGLIPFLAALSATQSGLMACPSLGVAAIELSPLVSDHMVLPVHGERVVLEGRASPRERVRATFGEKTARTRANEDGRWRLTWAVADLRPALQRASTSTLRFAGPTGPLFHDVTLGEVWLAAGQSNMVMPTQRAEGGEELAEDAVKAGLRFFRLESDGEDDLRGVRGQWVRASPGDAARFSAVATSFGVALHRGRQHVVGLVQAAWNGTPIESWIRLQAWIDAGQPGTQPPREPSPSQEAIRDFATKRAAWAEAARFHDSGDTGFGLGWANPTFDDSGWRTQEVPGAFESHGLDLDGVVWLRRRIALPAGCAGHALSLSLGPIDDCDRTFVNGLLVGSTCHEIADPYRVPRHYRVPASVVTSPSVLVAVRVVDEIGDGGLTGLPAEMRLTCSSAEGSKAGERDGAQARLDGTWRVQVEREASRNRPGPNDAPSPPRGWPTPATPGVLAENWIAELAPFPFNGVLWYQGENNLGQSARYATSLEVWLADWSTIFGRRDLPVLLVQLPGHEGSVRAELPGNEEPWARLREAQRQLTRHRNVRLVVTTDLGQGAEIHPPRKRPVGERAAWLALHEQATATGPWFRGMTRVPGGASLTFDAQGPLRSVREGQPLRGFGLVDEQGHEQPCEAMIRGQTVQLSWPTGKAVAAVRYGWDDLPGGTLTDETGWPASPFEALARAP